MNGTKTYTCLRCGTREESVVQRRCRCGASMEEAKAPTSSRAANKARYLVSQLLGLWPRISLDDRRDLVARIAAGVKKEP